MASWTDIHISVDLVTKARCYLDLLENYDGNSAVWITSASFRRAIQRYEQFWLPLLNEARAGIDVDAPKDIRWVWHHHMLLIGHYTDYCRQRFGRVLPHTLHTSATLIKAAREAAQDMWKMQYKLEPFEVEMTAAATQDTTPSRLGEVLEFARRQQDFYYQVSLPHYRDKEFLTLAVSRYKKFLHSLKFTAGDAEDMPYDVQLVWRVHALHPQDYLQDLSFLGHLFDPFNPYREHWPTAVSQALARKWEQLYSERFYENGTIFRGQPPAYIEALPKESNIHNVVDLCSIALDDIEITDPSGGTGLKPGTVLNVEVRRLNDSSFSYTVITTARCELGKRVQTKVTPNAVDFDSRTHRGLEFHIFTRSGRFCFAKETSVSTLFYNPRKHFEGGSFYNRTFPVELPRVVSRDPVVKFTCEVKAEERKPNVFLFDRQPFTQEECPAGLSKHVHEEPSWREIVRDNLHILLARHRLRNKEDPSLTFECEVVTREGPDSAAVSLYYHQNSLTCLAHSISSAQIPRYNQVSENCLLRITGSEDLALLIKNRDGDWGIILGTWAATERARGQIQLTLHKIQSRETKLVAVQEDEMRTIKIDYVTIDLPTGRITVDPAASCIPEQLVLAFCAGWLYVTCQKMAAMNSLTSNMPRQMSEDEKDLQKVLAASKSKASSISRAQAKKQNKRRKLSASFTFLLACGLQLDTYYNLTSAPAAHASVAGNGDLSVTSRSGDVILEPGTPKQGLRMNGAVGPYRSNHIMGLPVEPEESDIMDVKL